MYLWCARVSVTSTDIFFHFRINMHHRAKDIFCTDKYKIGQHVVRGNHDTLLEAWCYSELIGVQVFWVIFYWVTYLYHTVGKKSLQPCLFLCGFVLTSGQPVDILQHCGCCLGFLWASQGLIADILTFKDFQGPSYIIDYIVTSS